eukprot:8543497-Ditylum_brightwellii.AAC.1
MPMCPVILITDVLFQLWLNCPMHNSLKVMSTQYCIINLNVYGVNGKPQHSLCGVHIVYTKHPANDKDLPSDGPVQVTITVLLTITISAETTLISHPWDHQIQ